MSYIIPQEIELLFFYYIYERPNTATPIRLS
jgi:hypothetical protein